MGVFSKELDKSQVQPGDHLYTFRKLHTYSHHGICVEADRVIHFNRTKVAKKRSWMLRLWMLFRSTNKCNNCGHCPKKAGGVIKTCVDCFLHGHSLYRVEYGVSRARFVLKSPGTCTTSRSDSADNVIRRAKEKLEKGFGVYNLLTNNCETFAIFCKIDKEHAGGQAFAAINSVKILFKAFVVHKVGGLLHDLSVHHPDEHMQMNQTIDTLLTLPSKEIIAILIRLFQNHDNDQEDVNCEDLSDDDEYLQPIKEEEYSDTMEEEEEYLETTEEEGDDDGSIIFMFWALFLFALGVHFFVV